MGRYHDIFQVIIIPIQRSQRAKINKCIISKCLIKLTVLKQRSDLITEVLPYSWSCVSLRHQVLLLTHLLNHDYHTISCMCSTVMKYHKCMELYLKYRYFDIPVLQILQRVSSDIYIISWITANIGIPPSSGTHIHRHTHIHTCTHIHTHTIFILGTYKCSFLRPLSPLDNPTVCRDP